MIRFTILEKYNFPTVNFYSRTQFFIIYNIEKRGFMKEKLLEAKINKNDEFYTQLPDINNELKNYKSHFEGKVIFCNCDDPEWSNFTKYFLLNFEHLKIKKLISTHFEKDKLSYKLECNGEKNQNGELITHKSILNDNGDFRSIDCINLIEEADIIVTNPPFSLFREYVSLLIEYNKKFIIIGHQNAISYKEIFKLFKDNKIWLGYGFKGGAGFFINKHYEDYATASSHKKGMIRVSGVNWFTNLEIQKRYEELILYKNYTLEEYPKYENYNAINVDKTKDIPFDYFENIGVPITFMDKYNPEQFEIISLGITGSINFTSNRKMEIIKDGKLTGKFTFNAKGTLYRIYNPLKDEKPAFKDCETGELYSSIYARIIIKRIKRINYEN